MTALARARTVLSRASWGLWSVLGETWTLQAGAELGLDWICLDVQHGRWDDRSVVLGLDVVPDSVPVLVRVLSSDVGLIGRALDAGAAGIIVPMVETARQAAEVVTASRYPPLGKRSWGPIKAYTEASGHSAERIEPWLAVMIETADALAAAEEIAAVPGVDMLFVGPFDLSLSLGRGLDEVLAAADGPLQAIVRSARAAGLATGAYAGDPVRARRLREIGFDLVAATTELDVLRRGGEQVRAVLE